jgi:peptidoglycan/LPS O-acetylase OafA/YrhL
MMQLNNIENKKRLKNLFFVMVILLAIAVGYYFVCLNFPKFVIKCVFKEITGLRCPGCGVTRMLVSFMSLDFYEGFKYNIFLTITLPFVVYVIIYGCYVYITDRKWGKFFNTSCCVYVILLVLWGIVRNIIGC